MKKSKSLLVFALACFLAGVLATTLVYEAYFPQIAKVKGFGPEDPLEAWSEASYIIWQYNSTHYASRNMSTLLVEELNTNLTSISQNTNDYLQANNGGLIFLKDLQKPSGLTIGATVTVIAQYQNSIKIYTSTASGKIGNTPVRINGTFVLQNNTNEQTLLELTPTVITVLYNVFVDLNSLTQNCTIRVYSKIDGSNYREIPAMTLSLTAAAQTKGLALKELWIDTAFKITIQSLVAEGTTRNIPYRYFKEEY